MKLKIKGLTKIYDEAVAVKDLNIVVNSGEFVSILGPSGCGKSTLLYMIAGIVDPTEGDILFDDIGVIKTPIEKRNIGLVFQNYSLYPHMTVLENLIFPLRMANIKKRIAIEEANSIAKTLKIQELLKRKPKELSGGQQQRVAIGRALIKKPRLLLMDEPFSNLDTALRVEMREEVKELQKSFKITTLFVTHDQEEAMAISDKILLMNKGQSIQYSISEEIYSSPNSIFSASFIGNPKINLIEDYDKLLIKDVQTENCKVIGVRPEDVTISKIEEKFGVSDISGIIVDIQKLGKDIHFKVEVNGIILRGVSMDSINFHVGDKVKIKFKKIHFLIK